MLLFLALLCIGGAVYALSEAATYPARVKARSVKRAAEYGRIRIPRSEQELVQFRQRVLTPLAGKLAAIPLKLSPQDQRRGDRGSPGRGGDDAPADRLGIPHDQGRRDGRRLCYSDCCSPRSPQLASSILLVPVGAAIGLIGPEIFLDDRRPAAAATRSAASCRTRSICSPSASRRASASTARSRS